MDRIWLIVRDCVLPQASQSHTPNWLYFSARIGCFPKLNDNRSAPELLKHPYFDLGLIEQILLVEMEVRHSGLRPADYSLRADPVELCRFVRAYFALGVFHGE